MDEADLRRRAKNWVAKTTAGQGVSFHLYDPVALELIADILLSARQQRQRRQA